MGGKRPAWSSELSPSSRAHQPAPGGLGWSHQAPHLAPAPEACLVLLQRVVLHRFLVPRGVGGAGSGKQDPRPHSLTLFTSRKNVRAFFPFPGYQSPLNNAARLPPLPARPPFTAPPPPDPGPLPPHPMMSTLSPPTSHPLPPPWSPLGGLESPWQPLTTGSKAPLEA